ncbi:thermonuclease family protein [Rhodoferax sp.]|uniref:thermonuclease family protein n=1 Tax=Rhodoferax sp. TaxID=50421 RepID=UPI00262A3206|nr:thermonuclease family protein [Rhodoferax sp.]MDD2808657.1 thermonuclease family protein [Rhodoferax sp.]MDD4945056.1 thermonuclease family protein [Rhodoferax sp.]
MKHVWLWFCLLSPLWVAAEVFTAKVTYVSDGDTLWVSTKGMPARKLRLLGLDAPEICQTGGVASRDALRQWVGQHTVQVTVKSQDQYGRGLARVRIDSQDVGALMVASGQAWSSRWHGRLGSYAQQEARARANALGVFANPAAELPRDFRKRVGSCYVRLSNGHLKLKTL